MIHSSLLKPLTVLMMVFALAFMPVAKAQSAGGEVRGTITDPSGALVPSVTATLTGSSGYSKSVQSAHDGTYTFSNVPAGNYVVSISAGGFASVSLEDVKVVSGK